MLIKWWESQGIRLKIWNDFEFEKYRKKRNKLINENLNFKIYRIKMNKLISEINKVRTKLINELNKVKGEIKGEIINFKERKI